MTKRKSKNLAFEGTMKYIRILVPIISFAFLFVFFLPIIHYTTPCFGSSFPSCSGYESIGWAVVGWGAYTIANTAIYSPPYIALSPSYQFTSIGALLFAALPIFLIGIAFLFAELKKIVKSRQTLPKLSTESKL